jgi:hypothetical protein
MVFLFNGKSQGAKKGLGTWDDEEVIKKKKGKKSNMADLLFFFGCFIIVSLINFDRTCNKNQRKSERESDGRKDLSLIVL